MLVEVIGALELKNPPVVPSKSEKVNVVGPLRLPK
jgi:hypothetical protein